MDEAWKLEEEFWRAGSAGRDSVRAYYSRVLTSDAFVVVPGQVLAREELLRQEDGSIPWDRVAIDDRRTVLVNGQTVVLSYRVSASSPQAPRYDARVSSVYTWESGWALAFRQHTPASDDEEPSPADNGAAPRDAP
jgi:hypothetical protein